MKTSTKAVIPTPICVGDTVYITSGYGAGSKLVRIGGKEASDVWENKVMKNHHGGVVLVDGHLYGRKEPRLSPGLWPLLRVWGAA